MGPWVESRSYLGLKHVDPDPDLNRNPTVTDPNPNRIHRVQIRWIQTLKIRVRSDLDP